MKITRLAGQAFAATLVAALVISLGFAPVAAQESSTEESGGPEVTSVKPGDDENSGSDASYDTGERIFVDVVFSEGVRVSGTVRLGLNIGGTTRYAEPAWTRANTIRFRYTVQSGDTDLDGFSIDANSISLEAANGGEAGSIRDRSDANDADLDHSAVSTNRAHRVNAPDAPTLTFIDVTSTPGDGTNYVPGEVIEATAIFSMNVNLNTDSGSPSVAMTFSDDSEVTAAYSSTSNNKIVFTYTVLNTDRAPHGITIQADGLSLNNSSVTATSNGQAAVITTGWGSTYYSTTVNVGGL